MPARTTKLTQLGVAATYSHPDDPVPASKLMRSIAKHELDEFVDAFPGTRTGTDIFRSACRSVETRRKNGVTVEIKVDEVTHDSNECVYQVTRMVRDHANKLIEHPKAMTLVYSKATETIDVRKLEDYKELTGVEEAIREDFERNTKGKTIAGQKVRNGIRDVMHRLGGQNLRRKAGGLYFIPDTYRVPTSHGRTKQMPTGPKLDGLADMLHDIYGDRADFYVIPLPSTKDMKAMVSKHFHLNVRNASDDLLVKITQRVAAGGTPRPEFVSNIVNDYRKLTASIAQFDDIVGVERSEIGKNLKDLEAQLGVLQQLADPAPEQEAE